MGKSGGGLANLVSVLIINLGAARDGVLPREAAAGGPNGSQGKQSGEMKALARKGMTLEELKVGMVLATDVINQFSGEIVLRANTAIDDFALAKIRRYANDLAKHAEMSEHVDLRVLATLPDQQRVRFEAFSEEYVKTADTVVHYLDSVGHGMPIVLDELSSLTGDVLSKLKFKSDLFTFLDCLRGPDNFTYTHSINVALLSNIVGQWIGLSGEELTLLTCAAVVLDVGKAKISDDILSKKERLTDAEYDEIKKHPVYGYEILRPQDIPNQVKIAVLQHHERIDGSGYPYGLKDKEINRYAKIIAICDVYDAMVNDRPYRTKICAFDVIREFERRYFSSMDTQYLMVFLKNIAHNYLNRRVEMASGQLGEVVFISSSNISYPIVRMDNGSYVDLATDKTQSIVRIL
jgi:HD-GYP domain-containing protein (c-di-GMP phosphodiesterase class II)